LVKKSQGGREGQLILQPGGVFPLRWEGGKESLESFHCVNALAARRDTTVLKRGLPVSGGTLFGGKADKGIHRDEEVGGNQHIFYKGFYQKF